MGSRKRIGILVGIISRLLLKIRSRSNRGLTQQRQRPLPCKIRKRNIQPQQEQHTVNGCHNRHNQQQQQQQEENGGRYYPQEFPNGSECSQY